MEGNSIFCNMCDNWIHKRCNEAGNLILPVSMKHAQEESNSGMKVGDILHKMMQKLGLWQLYRLSGHQGLISIANNQKGFNAH